MFLLTSYSFIFGLVSLVNTLFPKIKNFCCVGGVYDPMQFFECPCENFCPPCPQDVPACLVSDLAFGCSQGLNIFVWYTLAKRNFRHPRFEDRLQRRQVRSSTEDARNDKLESGEERTTYTRVHALHRCHIINVSAD
jgi:hypothetical protein